MSALFTSDQTRSLLGLPPQTLLEAPRHSIKTTNVLGAWSDIQIYDILQSVT